MAQSGTRRLGVKAFERAHNLAGRLTRAALEASVLALLVAGVTINILAYSWSLSELRGDAIVHARIAADSTVAAMVFGDANAATDTLGFLKGSPEVLEATLFDSSGQRFARYESPDAVQNAARGIVEDDLLVVEQNLQHEGRALGKVQLRVSKQSLQYNFVWLAGTTLAAAFLGLGFAYLRVSRVRQAVNHTEEALDRLAFFDQVTDLHNRHAAKEYIEEALAFPDTEPFAVALLDLDDFKLVNDTLGHKAGDDLLRGLGVRLTSACGSNGTVFRLGGDEFIIVWDNVQDQKSLVRLGEQLVERLAEPMMVQDQAIFVRGSVGLATYPAHGRTYQELLRAADTAMYQAKSAGKNTYAIFNDAMAQCNAAKLQLATELSLALERNELVLHYQPIVDIVSSKLLGVEALVRWNHPQRGLLSAALFVDTAEESGLVVEMGGWVLKEAARQQAAWAREGLGHLFIAINVSGQQFKRNVLLSQVEKALAESNAAPSQLQIELTESTLVEDVASNVAGLERLRSLGIKVAIDDFGTGLSSLAYLKRLPIDKLKIDRSFVDDLATGGHEDRAIVTAIVSLAHALGLGIVAEGIETTAQLEALRELGAQHGQGYLFSRPVPAHRIAALNQCPWAPPSA